MPPTSHRRQFLQATTAAAAAGFLTRPATALAADEPMPLTTRGVGEVATPTFYRHDIGTASDRFHEPTAGPDGNIWTSVLDGNLWRYHAPTGETEIIDLMKLTGRSWSGLHLWAIAHGNDVYLCTPKLPELWVWHRDQKKVGRYAFPHKNPAVYGGFVVPGWDHLWLYDTTHAAVLKWDPKRMTGELFPCPQKLSGILYMTFAEPERHEIWGSTYTGNDLICFNVKKEKWTGHYKSPLDKATPTPGMKVFGDTLYVSDHLNGRLLPFNITRGMWGEAIPVPGFKKWFGYLSGGFHYQGKLYLVHSTWTGGTSSIDGEAHHFIGSLSVFDPATRKFSRLDMPERKGEDRKYIMADYITYVGDDMHLLAVDQRKPNRAMVLTTRELKK